MLADAAPEVVQAATDHEHTLGARERFCERGGIIEVAAANSKAAVGKVPQVLLSTADEHHLCGRDALEQFLHDKTTKLPGCSGDDDAHGDLRSPR
jgi:hypothetical protein